MKKWKYVAGVMFLWLAFGASAMAQEREMPDGLSVFGGKTGTTQAAGYCLIMGETDAGGKEYASVVMHADSRDALYSDMSKIMEKIDR